MIHVVTLYYLTLILLWTGSAHSISSQSPSHASHHQPRYSPTPDDASLNVKRAVAEGRQVFGRDVCDAAFPGEGAVQNLCTPSKTLCCVRKTESYPQCQNFLGKGWCCVKNADSDPGCYVDQASVCDQSGSVPCSGLAVGVSQACCPRLTTCATGYNFTETFVRCQIPSAALESLARATLSSTTSTTSTASSVPISTTPAPSTSLDVSSTSPASTSISTTPSSGSSSALSGGAIAGIAVGPTMALLVGIGLWFAYTRRQKKKRTQQPYQTAYQESPPFPAYQDGLHTVEMTSPSMSPVPYKYGHEANTTLQELPGQGRHELEARDDRRP
jgi:hypothetical protein